ncbi:MAG: polysaccharide deacetylase family protein [Clostridium sp.]|jgi:peptidoglycan-N-acetylmuramic acid deacetylase|nr:polysaccharide deacetylase family protein [Clostridium sp.]
MNNNSKPPSKIFILLPVALLLAAVLLTALLAAMVRGGIGSITDPPESTTQQAVTNPPESSADAVAAQTSSRRAERQALPTKEITTENPAEIPSLPTTPIAYSYGVASGGKPHQISVDNQAFFSSKGYNAVAYDNISEDKRLYLTFDCGYENGVTATILDVLKEKNVPAAFFATQHHLKTSPEIAARMLDEGHIIGNHSVSHPDFTEISRAKMIEELQGFDNFLRQSLGYTAPFFRFPEGSYNENALQLVQSLGYKSVFWSVSWADWDTTKQQGKQKAFDTISSRLHPGAIILLHAVSTDNAAALGDIIDYARANGYEFKALTDLPD